MKLIDAITFDKKKHYERDGVIFYFKNVGIVEDISPRDNYEIEYESDYYHAWRSTEEILLSMAQKRRIYSDEIQCQNQNT